MPADQYLARLSCHNELNNNPLGTTATPYVEALLTQRYAKRTRYRPAEVSGKSLKLCKVGSGGQLGAPPPLRHTRHNFRLRIISFMPSLA